MSEHEQIKQILEAHVGKDNQISARDIANKVGIDAGVSMVIIRKKIRETIIKYRIPVAAANRGYYFMEDDDEDLRRYQASLDKRAFIMLERKYLVTTFFKDHFNKEELVLGGEIFVPDEEDDE